jgi:hypothetical protein
MFRSTVMLDCLANKIPVVMPGWIDFGWNHALKGLTNISLAADFSDVEQRLKEWLSIPPQTTGDLPEFFVGPPGLGRDRFVSALQDLLSPAIASAELIDKVPVKPEDKRSCNYL